MLSAYDLLHKVYTILTHGGRTIKLAHKAMAKIADDSDYHRTEEGFTGYEQATVVKINNQEWVIAFGIKCGAYPAEPYNCDIAAVPISTKGKTLGQLRKEIYDALERNSYFNSSLVLALADGNLTTAKRSRFYPKVPELVAPQIKKFVAQELKTDPEVMHLDLRPVTISEIKYKDGFVEFLVDVFRQVLSS